MADAPHETLADSPLQRLGEAREFATKEANRFFLVGLLFSLLYGAKAAGYHLDEVILNKDVANIENGAFIYLVIAQVSMTLSHLRSADSSAFESSMKSLIRNASNDANPNISEIFPNAREWFSPISTSRMAETSKRIAIICEACGSDLVTRDAWAEWDVEGQKWVLGAAYDYAYCHKCDEETHLVEVELASARP